MFKSQRQGPNNATDNMLKAMVILHLYVRLLPLGYLTVAQKVIPFQMLAPSLFVFRSTNCRALRARRRNLANFASVRVLLGLKLSDLIA